MTKFVILIILGNSKTAANPVSWGNANSLNCRAVIGNNT